MDALHIIAPLVGVLIGGLLTVLNVFFRELKEQKRTVAIALTELLEIRHRLVAIDTILGLIKARVNLPPQNISAFRALIDSILFTNDAIDERYDRAVTVLAGVDPLLAFSLRSKNILPKLLASLRGLAINTGANLEEFEAAEGAIRLAAVPYLNTAVLELANRHSWLTKRRVTKLIAKAAEIPVELSSLLDQVKMSQSHVTKNEPNTTVKEVVK